MSLTTIGGLRDALSGLDPKARVYIDGLAPSALSSYRGFYDHLAIERDTSQAHTSTRLDERAKPVKSQYLGTYAPGHLEVQIKANATVGQLVKALDVAVGTWFEGYKGGQYRMEPSTPIWVSEWGNVDRLRIASVRVQDGRVDLTIEHDDL